MNQIKHTLRAYPFVLAFLMTFVICVGIAANANDEEAYAAMRANSQYSLAGAQYTLYTNDTCTSVAKDVNGNNAVLTTDERGSVNALEMETGDYWAKETKASPGYKLDTASHKITVSSNNTSDKPASFTSEEPPAYGTPDFTLYKVDSAGKYGWKNLIGAEYTIKYYDVALKSDISGSQPLKTWTFKTRKISIDDQKGIRYAGFEWQSDDPVSGSDDFYVVNGKRIIPLGWFTIEETNAPAGLALSADVFYGQVKQPENGSDAVTILEDADADGNVPAAVYANDEPQSVSIVINKRPVKADTEAELCSMASLAGAEYEVYFDDNDKPEPELVGTIITDEKGYGELTKREAGDERKIGDPLDPGDYYICETKASPGFMIDRYILADDGTTTERISGEIDVSVAYSSDGTPVTRTISGSYKDGRHIFKARLQAANTSVFEYTVTSNETARETHIKKTDATTAQELPGATLQIIQDDNVIEQWVSASEAHIVYGLPEGTYILREITAPYGYDIAEDIEFTVSEGEVVTNVEMLNKPVEVKTTATDADTDTHHGIRNEGENIRDTVKLSGLYKGRKYVITGKLWDKKAGTFVKDAAGNDLTATSDEFIANGDEAEIEMFFTVDSREFEEDTSLVACEYLSRTERIEGRDDKNDYPGEDFPKELAKHENPDDEDQTIVYGGIAETEAHDAQRGNHTVAGEKNSVIEDKVIFRNLSTKEEYTIQGELYDKTAGVLTGITSESGFTPENQDGTVNVEFRFDASQFKGHRLVAYETLLLNGVEISRHEDPDNEDQTVEVPAYEMYKVRTSEASKKGEMYGFDPGSAVTYDVVIANISPTASITMDITDRFTEGKKYFSVPEVIAVKGAEKNSVSKDKNKVNITIEAGNTATVTYVAVVKEDAKEYLAAAANDSDSLDKDGKDTNRKYQANKTDDRDGYRNVAKVKNPVPFYPDNPKETGEPLPPDEDEAQTPVKKPDIGTYLTDDSGAKTVDPAGSTILTDSVEYSGLTPGSWYALVGELVLKETGEPVSGSGENERDFVIFSPEASNGSETIAFIVDTDELAGKHAVAFETAYKIDHLDDDQIGVLDEIEKYGFKVAEHRDISDEDQTVSIKSPDKPNAPDTGDDYRPGLFAGICICSAALLLMLRKINSH